MVPNMVNVVPNMVYHISYHVQLRGRGGLANVNVVTQRAYETLSPLPRNHYIVSNNNFVNLSAHNIEFINNFILSSFSLQFQKFKITIKIK